MGLIEDKAILLRFSDARVSTKRELAAQLEATEVIANEPDNESRSGGHIKLKVPAGLPAVEVPTSTIDAAYLDNDGVPIQYILHFVGGNVSWLEYFRVDGEPIQNTSPGPDEIVIDPHGRDYD